MSSEGERTWRIAGGLPVDELERLIGFSVPDGDFETVAGLVIASEGVLLETGTVVKIVLPPDPRDFGREDPVYRTLEIEVAETERHVPSQLVLSLTEQEARDV